MENILLGNEGQRLELPWEVKYKIILEIAQGMEYIHDWEIIHRDLKSANVLLNDNFDCFLTDFGLSRATDQRMTLNLGTVFWMAPEVFSGDGTYTKSVDVFSFGVLLWEIVTRETPYNDLPSWSVPDKVIAGERLTIPSSCPIELKNLIESCWHQNPSRRPTFSQIVEIVKPKVDYLALRSIIAQLKQSEKEKEKEKDQKSPVKESQPIPIEVPAELEKLQTDSDTEPMARTCPSQLKFASFEKGSSFLANLNINTPRQLGIGHQRNWRANQSTEDLTATTTDLSLDSNDSPSES